MGTKIWLNFLLETWRFNSLTFCRIGDDNNNHKMSNSVAESEQILDRIQNHKGVSGIIIVNAEGVPIRSSMDNGTTQQYISMSKSLTKMARGLVRDIDPVNDLSFLRIKTKRSEIMIAPEPQSKEKESYLIVVQNDD